MSDVTPMGGGRLRRGVQRPHGRWRRAKVAVFVVVVLVVLAGGERGAGADGRMPGQRRPRERICCALATHLPLHLGTAHVPIVMGQMISTPLLGRHSYTGWDRLGENNGLLYTVRGGFIDTSHIRDNADTAAYLAIRLRPLLAAGSGTVEIDPLLSERRVVVDKVVPAAELQRTSARIAQRAAFEISVWAEIVQYWGRGEVRGAEAVYSAFTPDDLYSNLLGTYLGVAALASERPYDEALTDSIVAAMKRLGAVSTAEAERTINGLAGTWWARDTAWPSADIAILRSYDIGPQVHPVLAPANIAPAMPGGGTTSPAVIDVPQQDDAGEPLADFFHVELVPEPEALPHFATGSGGAPVVLTSADLPRLVAEVHAAAESNTAERQHTPPPRDEESPLSHYQNGLRLLELTGAGGIASETSERSVKGIGGGSLTSVVGDTGGGDFGFARFDVGETDQRGVIASFALFRSDVVYFCRDPETGRRRAPLVSLLGPCAPGERFGVGGSFAEGFHDGRTGRTALRPIGLHGVWNVLANGQSLSYRHVRLLLRGGGAVEHVWSVAERGDTIPRVGGQALVLARSSAGTIEARGTAGYRIDPFHTEDAGLESKASLRWNFLLGGKETDGRVDGVDPWGVGSFGVTSGIAYWSRPLHAYPDAAESFESTDHRVSFQLLLTMTLGFENFVF